MLKSQKRLSSKLAPCHNTGLLNELSYSSTPSAKRQESKHLHLLHATLHVHGALYKERGLLTASEKDIKNKEEILILLDAVWEPERVAVIQPFCRGHQKEDNPQAQGNRLADKTAKEAAEGLGVTSEAPIKALILAELPELTLDSLKYTEAQNELGKVEGAITTEKG